jgi:hypothetical protein
MGTYTYRLTRSYRDDDGEMHTETLGDMPIQARDLRSAEAEIAKRVQSREASTGEDLGFGLCGMPSLEEMRQDEKLSSNPSLNPSARFEMEDLPMKASAKKKTATRAATAKKSPSPRRRSTVTRSKTAKTTARPKKSLPPMRTPGEQPRDSFGRFARKTGAVIWGAAKGTVKAVGKAHKTVKRVRSDMRRRARLEERERRISLAEREKKLGLRKKAVKRGSKR